MEPGEIEVLIDELEDRVERLRAMYEQYFMGIERIEPLILRKDVDRRLWILRREQIRNTAMRFKLQTTIQRYNTFQQYWQRICREIENGTYHRDLGRAAERFGEVALTAIGKRRQRMYERGVAKQAEREAARVARASEAPPPDVAAIATKAASPPIAIPRPAALPLPAPDPTPQPFEPLELDMGFDSEPAPTTPKQGFPSAPPPPPPSVHRVKVPAGPGAPVATLPMRGPAAPPAGSPRAAFAGASPSPARPPPPPMPAAPPARVAIPPPMPPGATATAPLAAAAARPSSGNGASTPAPSQPDEGDISTSRLRQIYGQYVEAKRRCNESTATITFDKVAKNLRTTAMQLKDKHQGRNIDFEVVVKNGTPVLKPVVKGRT